MLAKEKDHKTAKRISFAIDDKVLGALDNLAVEDGRNKSEVIRKAILTYSNFFSGGEYIIADIDLWSTIIEELNKGASKSFWEQIEDIGYRYGVQCKTKGLVGLQDVLEYLETWNWFKLKPEENGATLVLYIRNEQKILKALLESLFKALETPVEIVEGLNKLIILDKSYHNWSEK